MLEVHGGELLRHLDRRIHVSERRREDQLVAGLRELADHALGVGAFRDVLDVFRRHLAGQVLFHREPRDVVLMRPAGVADRAHVHEADLERLFRLCDGGQRDRDGQSRQRGNRLPAGHAKHRGLLGVGGNATGRHCTPFIRDDTACRAMPAR